MADENYGKMADYLRCGKMADENYYLRCGI